MYFVIESFYQMKPQHKKLLICTMLSYLCIVTNAQLPTFGDCLGALPICDSIYVEMISPNNPGNFVNEIHEDCCISLEQNSIWYKFRIKQSGMLGFNIIPQAENYDYDWALFNITNSTCADIANDFSLITSCNAAGGEIDDGSGNCYGETGPDGTTDFFFQNANCGTFPPTLDSDGFSPFNDFIPVIEGQLYALLILEFTPDVPDGFMIDFTYADDVGIYDEDRPNATEITAIYEDCQIVGFTVEFDEEIVCNSFRYNDLNIVAGGSVIDGNLSSEDCDVGQLSSIFTVTFDSPIPAGETLAVSSNDDPFDLCANPIFEFQFTEESISEFDTIIRPTVYLCDDVTTIIQEDLQGLFNNIIWSTNETSTEIEVGVGNYEAILNGECGQRVVKYTIETGIPFIELDIISECNGESTLEIVEEGDYMYSLNGINYDSPTDIPTLSSDQYDLIVSNENCQTTISFEVENLESEIEILGENEYTIVQGDSIDLIVEILGNYENSYWIDNGEIVCENCTSYEVSPISDAEYIVEAIDENGCIVRFIIIVRVKSQYDIYAPNIFTPNEDGLNDRFMIFGRQSIENIAFLEIYDRWGERVYQAIDLEANNPNIGWDGNFKSLPSGAGVYSWIARVNFKDGFQRDLYGTITLVR